MRKYLTELHLHTKESSACSEMPVKDIMDEYKKKGYSTIVITDHCSKKKLDRLGNLTWKEKVDYVFKGFDIAKEYGAKIGINVLLGVEITLTKTNSDYVVYGISKDFLYQNEEIYNYTIKDIYNICCKNGVLLVQAHPFREGIELAPLECVDGIEVYNGCQNEISRNEKALEYGKTTNKILTSGSDFHRLDDLARGGIFTESMISENKELIKILKSGNFKIKQS